MEATEGEKAEKVAYVLNEVSVGERGDVRTAIHRVQILDGLATNGNQAKSNDRTWRESAMGDVTTKQPRQQPLDWSKTINHESKKHSKG